MNHPPAHHPHDRKSFFDAIAERWDDLHPHAPQRGAVTRGLDLVEPLANAAIIDVGCGTGIVTNTVLPRIANGTVLALDLSPSMIAKARESLCDPRVELRVGDALDAAIASASVDVVLCYNTVPHFSSANAAVQEMARWLRPGGRLLIWHDAGRSQIHHMHHHVGGPVAHDMLPPADQLASLMAGAGLTLLCQDDLPDRYTVLGALPAIHAEV